jgi:hypothetical protein
MISRDALPQWIWATTKDRGPILVYVSDADIYAWGPGTRIEFISGAYLDVTGSLDEIATKIGAPSLAVGSEVQVFENGRWRVLRHLDEILCKSSLGLAWFRDFVHARIKRPLDHFYALLTQA